MKRFPDREELVAAYWQKLTSTIESVGLTPRAKTQGMNKRLRSRQRLGVRQRAAVLRHRKRLSEIPGPVGQHAQLHSHS
jgi:hypothetical protein